MMECPKFSGEDFPGWLTKIEQFFDVDNTKEAEKVRVVMMHLSGEALHWHLRFAKTKGNLSEIQQKDYAYAMKTCFCEIKYANPMFEISNIR